MLVSDYFTRWIEAYPLPNHEAPTLAKVLVNEWICRFGVPDVIHSDQGKNFESRLFAEVCHLLEMEKTKTTSYHSQSDGLVERFNRTLQMLLTVRMNQVPEDTWDKELPVGLPLKCAGEYPVHSLPTDVWTRNPIACRHNLWRWHHSRRDTRYYVTQLGKRLEQAYEELR